MQIEVDFDVWKALTVRRATEEDSYNDVLRQILGLDADEFSENGVGGRITAANLIRSAAGEGLALKGLFLPNGTSLRAIYKGVPYIAKIEDGHWVGMDGRYHNSPSSAASDITKNNVNGWRFWEALLPNDGVWRRLDVLADRTNG